jgi:hypothetical protein
VLFYTVILRGRRKKGDSGVEMNEAVTD